LLEAGFRAVEEVVLASLEDLTAIDGIDEDTAIDLHDAAETLLEQWNAEAAAAAEAGEDEETEASTVVAEAAEPDAVEETEAVANVTETDNDVNETIEETDKPGTPAE